MKIAILISGRGSNMVALVDAVKSGEIPASEVAVVISDKRDAAGLEKARERGVDAVVVERNGRTREEHDAEIISVLNSYGVELVCLAGYMRLLSPGFIRAFPDRIVNIHPSLLPSFPGLNAQKQALEAGAEFSGCTVHFVDELLDHGPAILQQWVSVEKGDSVRSLSDRILEVEHKLYIEALKHLAIEHIGQRTKQPKKYKVLKALAHNFSHSFVSLMNYMDGNYVIDELRELVHQKSDHRILVDWIPGNNSDAELTPRIRKSVQSYRQSLIRDAHNLGVLLSSIKEFRTEIYLLKNRQMAVDGVIVDDRGRTYKAPVYDF